MKSYLESLLCTSRLFRSFTGIGTFWSTLNIMDLKEKKLVDVQKGESQLDVSVDQLILGVNRQRCKMAMQNCTFCPKSFPNCYEAPRRVYPILVYFLDAV